MFVFLPDTAKSTNTRCSQMHQNPPCILQLQSELDRKYRVNSSKANERLATGKEVEIVADKTTSGLNKKTPSLDNVLEQIKGEIGV